MSATLHAGLAAGRWRDLTLMEQLANIGSEVGRATRAKSIGSDQRFANALDRCLELFDLTITDDRWRYRRREITRAREVVCDFLVGDNAYDSTADSLDRYFLPYAIAARSERWAQRATDQDAARESGDPDRARDEAIDSWTTQGHGGRHVPGGGRWFDDPA